MYPEDRGTKWRCIRPCVCVCVSAARTALISVFKHLTFVFYCILFCPFCLPSVLLSVMLFFLLWPLTWMVHKLHEPHWDAETVPYATVMRTSGQSMLRDRQLLTATDRVGCVTSISNVAFCAGALYVASKISRDFGRTSFLEQSLRLLDTRRCLRARVKSLGTLFLFAVPVCACVITGTPTHVQQGVNSSSSDVVSSSFCCPLTQSHSQVGWLKKETKDGMCWQFSWYRDEQQQWGGALWKAGEWIRF